MSTRVTELCFTAFFVGGAAVVAYIVIKIGLALLS